MNSTKLAGTNPVFRIVYVLLFLCIAAPLQADEGVKWWHGGNLHKATVSEWKEASQANKVATVSDWLAATLWKGKLTSMDAFDKLKIKSTMLANAVDNAVQGEGMGEMKVLEVAAAIVTIANDLGP